MATNTSQVQKSYQEVISDVVTISTQVTKTYQEAVTDAAIVPAVSATKVYQEAVTSVDTGTSVATQVPKIWVEVISDLPGTSRRIVSVFTG